MISDIGNLTAGAALGACVRSARLAVGLSQEDLARRAGVGTSTLRQIESGSATGTSIFTVFRILDACGAPLTSLEAVFAATVTDEGSTRVDSTRQARSPRFGRTPRPAPPNP